jgi:hypothetical protein
MGVWRWREVVGGRGSARAGAFVVCLCGQAGAVGRARWGWEIGTSATRGGAFVEVKDAIVRHGVRRAQVNDMSSER